MTNRFDEILDDCLTRVMLYGESVEACLQRYPDHAAELREQLEVVRIAQEAYRPKASAKDRARAALLAAMEEQPAAAPVMQAAPVQRAAPPNNGASPWGHWRSRRFERQRFEEALDSCITALVIQGASVESCLERYPDLAADLAPHLAVAARAQQAYVFTPRPEAKVKARAQLHRTLREEAAGEIGIPARGFFLPWFGQGGMRWGSSLAAVLLAALVGSSTVAASNDALPGDALYPVKTAVEQAALAVQLSPEDKAELHLQFATRRADELTQVLPRGQTGAVQPVLENLSAHLGEAARISVTIGNPDAQEGLKSRVASSAAHALSGLQMAVTRSSGPARDTAEVVLATSGDAFASAIEQISSRSSREDRQPVAAQGTVVLRVANPVPSNLDRLLIRVGAIEAHMASGAWVTLSTDPQVFDLRRADTAQWLLGDFRVPAGTYTQVRLSILEVTAWSRGEERDVEVPSGGLRMVRPFTVAGGEPTVVLLNFEGRRSITPKADGNLQLRPAVQVQVDEPAAREREKEDRRGREAPAEIPQTVRTAIDGVLEAVNREAVQVRGKLIALGSFTRIEGVPVVGRRVRIEAEVQSDGHLRAISIEVREPREDSDRSGRGSGEERDNAPRAERETPQRTAPPGPSESHRDDGEDGGRGNERQPATTPADDHPGVANREREEREEREERQREQRRDQEERTDQQERQRQERERQEQQERERERQRATATPTPSPTAIQMEGTISRIGPNQWVVDGHTIIIRASTRIDGDPVVGATARVNGLLQQDGSIIATGIRVQVRRERTREEEEEDERQRERERARQVPPTATPTATPQPERSRDRREPEQENDRDRNERPETRTVPAPSTSPLPSSLPSPSVGPSPSPAPAPVPSGDRTRDSDRDKDKEKDADKEDKRPAAATPTPDARRNNDDRGAR